MNRKEIKQNKHDSLMKWKDIEDELLTLMWTIETICGYCHIVDCCCNECILAKNELCNYKDNKKFTIWECQKHIGAAVDAAHTIRKFIEKDIGGKK